MASPTTKGFDARKTLWVVAPRSQQASGDDADAEFAAWYAQQYAPILRAVTVVATDRAVAEDVVAEAFARALERWDRVSAMGSPDGWTYRVAVNLLHRRGRRRLKEDRLWRRQANRHAQEPPLADIDLWNAVAGLTPRAREAIALRYVLGFKEREVAEWMGITEGAASATLAAARQRLAGLLRSTTPEEVINADG